MKVQTHPGAEGPVLVSPAPGVWTSRASCRRRASVLALTSPLPERAANRNSPGFSISRHAPGFSSEPTGFPPGTSAQLLQPQPGAGTTFVSRQLEHLLPWVQTLRHVLLSAVIRKRCLELGCSKSFCSDWVPAGQAFQACAVHPRQVVDDSPLRCSKHILS